MSTFSWKFDVALSFAGADREAALAIAEALRKHGLSIFYDDWYQTEIWGRDLVTLLPEIYSAARVCIVLISKSYVNRPYAQHELEFILERRLLQTKDFLLPVRLDNAKVPGMPSTIAFIEYAQAGAEKIASMAAKRLASASAAAPSRQENPPAPQAPAHGTEQRPVLSHFSRSIPELYYTLDEPDLIAAFNNPDVYATAAGRAVVAYEMTIFLNWKHHANLGTPYGAWREGDKVYLSTLPNLNAATRTLEFDLQQPRGALLLSAVWTTTDERYEEIPYWAWQPAVKGLTSDRGDLDLDREVVIKILEERKAAFAFPITPAGSAAEKLCGWIEKEPPSDYESWSLDPRLVTGKLNVWQASYHRPSGVGLLQFSLHGRWPPASFRTLRDALTIMLPTRYNVFTVGHACIRVAVFLCAFETMGKSADYPEERDLLGAAAARVHATIARMTAAQRRLPLPPLRDDAALPPLSDRQQSLFQWAVEEQGPKEFTPLTDGAHADFYEAKWVKLRQADYGISDPRRFSDADTVTPSEIVRYVEGCEWPVTSR